jgi:hypothetical protein
MDDSLAKDLVAMWQSELTAMATDRELGESWTALAALWAQSTRTALAVLRREPPAGSPSPAEPPRTAPAAATSQPGLGEIEQLNRRIAELEQRLAEYMGREPVAPGPVAAPGSGTVPDKL